MGEGRRSWRVVLRSALMGGAGRTSTLRLALMHRGAVEAYAPSGAPVTKGVPWLLDVSRKRQNGTNRRQHETQIDWALFGHFSNFPMADFCGLQKTGGGDESPSGVTTLAAKPPVANRRRPPAIGTPQTLREGPASIGIQPETLGLLRLSAPHGLVVHQRVWSMVRQARKGAGDIGRGG